MNHFQAFELECWNNYENNKYPILPDKKYGITYTDIKVPKGMKGSILLGVRHLTGAENNGNHNIYFTVLDTNGDWLNEHDPSKIGRVDVNFCGTTSMTVLDKPKSDLTMGNSPMWGECNECSVWFEAEDSAHGGFDYKEIISGFSTRHADEDPGNTWGHHSFHVVFGSIIGPKTKSSIHVENSNIRILPEIRMIIIHMEDNLSYKELLDQFNDPTTQRSLHSTIDQDGTRIDWVTDERSAWHTVGKVGEKATINDDSLSIGLLENEKKYTKKQYKELVRYCAEKCLLYNILPQMIFSHNQVTGKKHKKKKFIHKLRKKVRNEIFKKL